MDFFEVVRQRKTIRDFEDKAIPGEILHKIISAGMHAPSNNHLKEWEFIVIQDREKKLELIQNIRELRNPIDIDQLLDEWKMTDPLQRNMYHEGIPKQQSMILTAAVVILPCFHVKSPLLKPKSLSDLNYFASIWCCIENMLLAAAAEGIFGVTRIPFEEETIMLTKSLSIPDGYEIPCYLVLGYPLAGAIRPKQIEYNLSKRIHINHW
jgi:nitroreductase